MGQKINPTGFRLPVTRDWTSRWYADGRDYPSTLHEDLKVRNFLLKKLRNASVSRILIERPANNARITIFTARPGIVIGRQGADIEALKAEVQKMMGVPVHVNIEEVRRPDIDAQLIADNITQQLEKRVMFRRAMKRAMQNAMRQGALGIKIMSSGRLNGADTQIICALGTMNYYLYHDIASAVEQYRLQTGDAHIHLLRFRPIHPFDGLGADGHPSLDTHRKMADELASFIQSLDS